MKVLEVGSLLLFGLLLLYTLIAAPHWSVATVRLAVDGGLAIVLVSLAIGAPFTLQYARERVPKEYWASPLFLATNQRITGVWGGLRGDDYRRRSSGVYRSDFALDRNRGNDQRICRGRVVHAMVSGSGAPPRRERRRHWCVTQKRLAARLSAGLKGNVSVLAQSWPNSMSGVQSLLGGKVDMTACPKKSESDPI